MEFCAQLHNMVAFRQIQRFSEWTGFTFRIFWTVCFLFLFFVRSRSLSGAALGRVGRSHFNIHFFFSDTHILRLCCELCGVSFINNNNLTFICSTAVQTKRKFVALDGTGFAEAAFWNSGNAFRHILIQRLNRILMLCCLFLNATNIWTVGWNFALCLFFVNQHVWIYLAVICLITNLRNLE